MKVFYCVYGLGLNYCNYVFFILIENCVDFGFFLNGFRRGRDFKYERKVIFVCCVGFMLNGVNSIMCNDGVWSNEFLFCIGKDVYEWFSELVFVIGFFFYCFIML